MTEEVLPPGASIRATTDAGRLARLLEKVSRIASGIPKGLGTPQVQVDAVPDGTSAAHIEVTLKAPNLTFTGSVPAVVAEGGSFMTPALEFAAYEKRASGKVEFTAIDAGRISMRNGRTQWALHASYPDAAVGHDREPLATSVVEGSDFRTALAAALPALPPSSGRLALQRIRIDHHGATATDGNLTVRHGIPGIGKITVNLPPIVAKILLASKASEYVLTQDAVSTAILADSYTLRVNRDSLEYPDIERVIQAAAIEDHGLLLVNVEAMKSALANVRALSDVANSAVTIRAYQQNQKWITGLLCEDRSGAMAREIVVGASWQAAKPLAAVFNHQHLSRILDACQEEEVDLRIGGSSLFVEDPDRGFQAIARQIVV